MKKIYTIIILLIPLIFLQAGAKESVKLAGSLNPHGSHGYNDIWGYAADGREYAILGTTRGTSIVDVTNPGSPVEVGFVSGPQSTWRDMKVHSHYAYVVTEGEGEDMGLQIIDLSGLPNSVALVKSTTEFFQTAHNIFIDNGFAYVIGTNNGGGMHILDLSDPVNPSETNYYLGSNYIHDVYVWSDTVIACAATTYDVVDVSDKSNPVKVSSSPALPGIYAHSGWMTEDKRYFIAAEESNERDLMVWDLEDRTKWKLVVDRLMLSTESPIHNIFVRGDYAHISYYKEGYVVIDISNPENPLVVGQYDTYEPDQGFFSGAWGCYPFLPSGNIIVSDRSTGLYVFEFNPPDNPAPFISLKNPVTEKLDKEPVEIEVEIFDNGTVTENALYYRIKDESGSWIKLEGKNKEGAIYSYTIPEQENGTVIEYFITAEDDENIFVTSPKGGSKESGEITPPQTFYTLKFLYIGKPIIVSISPDITDTTITIGEEVEFGVEAVDTTGLELTYKWFFRGGLRSFSSSYTHRSSSQIVPRTDTVRLEISNGYKITEREFYIHVEENVTSVEDEVDLTYHLAQNYPNPFNPSTTINYTLSEQKFVNLTIYNSIGEVVKVLVNEVQNKASYDLSFNAEGLSSGFYIARLTAGSFVQTIKMLLVK